MMSLWNKKLFIRNIVLFMVVNLIAVISVFLADYFKLNKDNYIIISIFILAVFLSYPFFIIKQYLQTYKAFLISFFILFLHSFIITFFMKQWGLGLMTVVVPQLMLFVLVYILNITLGKDSL